jgi:hypothetical protein
MYSLTFSGSMPVPEHTGQVLVSLPKGHSLSMAWYLDFMAASRTDHPLTLQINTIRAAGHYDPFARCQTALPEAPMRHRASSAISPLGPRLSEGWCSVLSALGTGREGVHVACLPQPSIQGPAICFHRLLALQ